MKFMLGGGVALGFPVNGLDRYLAIRREMPWVVRVGTKPLRPDTLILVIRGRFDYCPESNLLSIDDSNRKYIL